MPLTDVEIRKAKPTDKIAKMSDGGGLQLWIFPEGAKRWRLAYRFAGKQKTLAVGVYPAVSLVEARAAREEARRLLADGIDPGTAKKSAKAAKAHASASTFDALADEILEKATRENKAENTLKKLTWLLSLVRPALGSRPIAEISAADVLAALRPIEARGRLETVKRLRATIGQVFRYAIATSRAENDPTGALKGAFIAPTVTNRAAIIDPIAFGAMLRAIDSYRGTPETIAALKVLAFTLARPGEVRSMEWVELDLEAAVWKVPASKMKMKREHRVPLAPCVVAILKDMRAISGDGKFVFPSVRTKKRCLSENTLNEALKNMGIARDEHCAHGFRTSASSMLNECGLWHADAVERQLAHVDKNSMRRIYHRADYWDERIEMMNYWADCCDAMKRGGDVVPFKQSGGNPA